MTISQHNLTKGNANMTSKDDNAKQDKIVDVLNRMFSGETEADKELLWVGVIAFICGALIF